MECINPEHMYGPPEVCGGCYAEAEREVTRLRDQQARRITEDRDLHKRTEAAARRAAHGHMATWAGLYYIKPALAGITWPLEETLGAATQIDPAWGRTQDQRRRLESIQVRATQAQQRWWEITAAGEPAWKDDPREAEILRLRKVIEEHGQALHRQYAPPRDGFTACRCPGCELIAAMDAG